MNDWEQILTEHPKVLWGLVADVVKAVKAGEGDKKTGRRPSSTSRTSPPTSRSGT